MFWSSGSTLTVIAEKERAEIIAARLACHADLGDRFIPMKSNSHRHPVLYLAKGFPPDPGGVEQYSLDVATAFADLGLSPIVITQHSGARGVRHRHGLVTINVGSGSQLVVFLRMMGAVLALRKRFNFVFTYATTWRVAIPAILARVACPLGITIHGREILVPRNIVALIMKWVLRRADFLFCVSQFTLDAGRSRNLIPLDKGLRNWNGLPKVPNVERREKSASGTTTLFTICRLVERKNIQGVISALAVLRDQGRIQGVKYVVAGDGEMRGRLQALIVQKNLEQTVSLLGRISEEEKRELYASADVFVHAQVSLSGGDDVEGFGLVIAEAMACGLPVLVGRDGGTADFVENGETGLVVDGNSIPEIAESLARMIEDVNFRNRIAINGRIWVHRNLSWRKHAVTIVKQCFPGIDLPQDGYADDGRV